MITKTVSYTTSVDTTVGTYTLDTTIADIPLDPSSESVGFYSISRGLAAATHSVYLRINDTLYQYKKGIGNSDKQVRDICFGEGLVVKLLTLPAGDAHTSIVSVCQAQKY
jgi:hypothetical protein